MSLRETPGEHAGTRGAAGESADGETRETDARIRKSIQVRSGIERVAVAAQGSYWLLVSHDEKNIHWLLLRAADPARQGGNKECTSYSTFQEITPGY